MTARNLIQTLLFIFIPVLSFSQARIIKFNELQSMLSKQNDTCYVVNFWATWCKPCVAELPYFEELNKLYSDKKLKVILVSLDFKKDFDTRLQPFIDENKIQSQVVLLNEPDYNSWIDKVDADWQGNIPATLIYNYKNKYRKFYPHEFTNDELQTIIKPLIN